MSNTKEQWMRQAIALAVGNVRQGRGGPFGAVVVRNGELISSAVNIVTESLDPTAHAEVVAIRNACIQLGTYQLEDCELYTSCEPCPMCLGAIYWARIERFYFSATRVNAAAAGFDDAFIYDEMNLDPEQRSIAGHALLSSEGGAAFTEWEQSLNKALY